MTTLYCKIVCWYMMHCTVYRLFVSTTFLSIHVKFILYILEHTLRIDFLSSTATVSDTESIPSLVNVFLIGINLLVFSKLAYMTLLDINSRKWYSSTVLIHTINYFMATYFFIPLFLLLSLHIVFFLSPHSAIIPLPFPQFLSQFY